MPFRSSLAVPQWAAKQQSPEGSKKTSPKSTESSNASKPDNSNELLVIEDLDLADLDISPSTVKTYDQSTDEASVDEYCVFPEPDSSTYFGEQVPTVVSETCLMNDLYILVKVPTNPKQYIPTSNASSQTSATRAQMPSKERAAKNHAIFSIQEEEEEHSVQEPKSKIPIRMKSNTRLPCWVRDKDGFEEFSSRTNIIHHNYIVPLPNEVPEQVEDPVFEVAQHTHEPQPPCQNQIELQEVSLNSPRFRGRVNVSLENYGILITPTKTPKTENLLVFQVDTEPKAEKDRGRGASCFEWFTKFFRRKRRRTGFVHAKVYKTYFVKWKNCSEDSECSRCQCKTSKTLRRNST